MIANLLVFLLIIGLVVLFGWLTYRAIRAKKLWVKIVGGIGAGLLTLLFVVVAFMGAKGMAATYFPGLTLPPTSKWPARPSRSPAAITWSTSPASAVMAPGTPVALPPRRIR